MTFFLMAFCVLCVGTVSLVLFTLSMRVLATGRCVMRKVLQVCTAKGIQSMGTISRTFWQREDVTSEKFYEFAQPKEFRAWGPLVKRLGKVAACVGVSTFLSPQT